MQHRFCDTAESAFRAPSVMNRGREGSSSHCRAPGGTSKDMRVLAGVSYLVALPLMIRPGLRYFGTRLVEHVV